MRHLGYHADIPNSTPIADPARPSSSAGKQTGSFATAGTENGQSANDPIADMILRERLLVNVPHKHSAEIAI